MRLDSRGLRRDALLFGESPSRVVLSVSPDQGDRVVQEARAKGVPAVDIGEVGGNELMIEVPTDSSGPGCSIQVDVRSLYARWSQSLETRITESQSVASV